LVYLQDYTEKQVNKNKLFSDVFLIPTNTGMGKFALASRWILYQPTYFLSGVGGWLLFASNWSIEPLDKCNVSGE
jgi:hypothetical protein